MRQFFLTITVVALSGAVHSQLQVFFEEQKLNASDAYFNCRYGTSVDIDNGRAVIGAYKGGVFLDSTTLDRHGAAYTYEMDVSGQWNESQKILPLDSSGYNDAFGLSVSINGDYLIVGDPYEGEYAVGSVNDAGAVYLFKNDSGNWLQEQKLVANVRNVNSRFGQSIAIDGDYAVIGAPADSYDSVESNFVSSAGAAYIFKKNVNGFWVQTQKIVASNREFSALFGTSVDIQGTQIIVGSRTFPGGGGAYVFEMSTSENWNEVAFIQADNMSYQAQFGCSVAIHDSVAVIGSYNETQGVGVGAAYYYAGAAYIVEKESGVWNLVQKIVSPDRNCYHYFGYAVDIDEGNVAIGSYGYNGKGGAFVFSKVNGNWETPNQVFLASDGYTSDELGRSVAVDGLYLVAGAWQDNTGTPGYLPTSNVGSAYIFTRDVLEIQHNCLQSIISAYPNPTTGGLHIDLGKKYQDVSVSVINTLGQKVEADIFVDGKMIELWLKGVPGVYYIELSSLNQFLTRLKIVKK